jgi:hypothetical protein
MIAVIRCGLDRVEVDVLEGAAQHAHLVDGLAGRDEVGDDPRRVLTARAVEVPHAGCRLDLHPARARELVRATGGDHGAGGEDRHAVAHQLDLAEQMRVQQHGDAPPAELFQKLANDAPPHRIEGAGRLVEQQEPGRPDQRLGDPQPLLHALGHRRHPHGARVGQADQLEQLGSLARSARRPRQPLVQHQHLVRRRPSGKAEQLGEVAQRPPCGRRAGRRATHLGRPAGRAHEPAGDLRQRRLAGTVGPEEADELARPHFEVDPGQRRLGAVALGQPPASEGGQTP